MDNPERRRLYLIEFRKIPSLKFLYEISPYGIIRNVKSKMVNAPYLEESGYWRISFHNSSLTNGDKVLHCCLNRLVAECWCEKPPHLFEYKLDDLQVNHIDGNKSNNNYDNLEWCLPYENIRHAFNIGLREESEAWKEKKMPKKPIRCVEEKLDFESSYQAAEWLINKFQYKKRYVTVAQSIRETARKKHSKSYGYTWEYI